MGMSLRAGCQLKSLAEKDLITGSNCPTKQDLGVTLKMQLSEKTGLAIKKAR